MPDKMLTYGALALAIICEVIGTTLLPQTRQFSRPVPTVMMAVCYGAAFYLMSFAVKTLPVGVVYAIWSGMGIVLIAAVNYVFFKQALDGPALLGLGLIIAGVAVINTLSKTVPH